MEKATVKNFAQSLKKSKLVIADFMADWCIPCKQMGTTIDAVEPRCVNKVKFLSCNYEKESGLFHRFGVTFIPTLMVFKDGELINRQSGAISDIQLVEKIEGLLKQQNY